MHPDWARSLRDQCQAAGVAFHFKQWGEWGQADSVEATGLASFNWHERTDDGGALHWCHEHGHLTCFASCDPLYRVGKKAAGRELDGRTWDEFPKETA